MNQLNRLDIGEQDGSYQLRQQLNELFDLRFISDTVIRLLILFSIRQFGAKGVGDSEASFASLAMTAVSYLACTDETLLSKSAIEMQEMTCSAG